MYVVRVCFLACIMVLPAMPEGLVIVVYCRYVSTLREAGSSQSLFTKDHQGLIWQAKT
jgi:hypothetical protein